MGNGQPLQKTERKTGEASRKTQNPTRKHTGRQPTLYRRTINLTDIHFTDEEQKLLDLQPTLYPRTIKLTDTHFTDEEQKLLDLQPTLYPRTINLTDIHFTDEEQKLLDLGLQYSMQKPTKITWENLFIETERAI